MDSPLKSFLYIGSSTKGGHFIAAADAVRPLVLLMKEFLMSLKVLHGDETPIQVLKGTGKKPQSKAYLWSICSPMDEPPAFYFEYHPNRSSSAALALLEGFQGHLHVDGFQGYNILSDRPGITRVACWAHARRKFDVAQKDGAPSGASLSSQFLEAIQKLFKLEKDWVNLTPEDRLKHRTQYSVPIVDSIRRLLDDNVNKVLPKSKLGGAWATWLTIGKTSPSSSAMAVAHCTTTVWKMP